MAPAAHLIVPAVSPFSANQNARPRRKFHVPQNARTHPSTRSLDINGNVASKSQVTGTVTLGVTYTYLLARKIPLKLISLAALRCTYVTGMHSSDQRCHTWAAMIG
jgi:outer membrane protein W